MINDETKMALMSDESIREIREGYIHDLKLGIDVLETLNKLMVDYSSFAIVYNDIKQDTLGAKEEAIKNGLPESLFHDLEIELLEFDFRQLIVKKATQIQNFLGGAQLVN